MLEKEQHDKVCWSDSMIKCNGKGQSGKVCLKKDGMIKCAGVTA